ncbi:hypothetical protein [Bradyrhizobium sp. CCGE-LA001]|uniref:hypothetical protein n=1 Tax=Bradyrhizobium sp. CCGE-LA001 TaxID=1223566 RepID=UPI0002D4D058|nr:hypothetical protein [Bradyrhizobium sp. CCGE-LA001]AMA57150.1 hypothetical protein BCCGELA001_13415 [Bradyrhizobium sp. CCGE-LA001]
MNQRWIIVAAILLTALFVQMPVVLNTDLSCLLSEGEQILDGRQLGVDLFELNPPLSIYLYMPAAQLARWTGIAPEIIVIVLVIIEIIGSLVVIDRAAAAAKLDARERNIWTCVLAFLLAVLPGAVFGQREHIAVIAMTPFVAVTAIRWRRLSPGLAAILAGLGAGLAISIKPQLGLVAGLPIILGAIRQRSLRPLFTPEACAAAAVAIGYGAVVVIAFPDYLLTYAPMVAATYLPMRRDLAYLLPFPILIITASIVFLRRVTSQGLRLESEATPWLAAAIGGAASFLIQGKGWTYTLYPLCMFAIAAPLLHVRTGALPRLVRIGGFVSVVLIGFWLSLSVRDFPPLEQRINALAKHPKLLTIGDHVALGHPLVRQIGGTWVGSSCGQLLTAGAILVQNSSQPSQAERAKLDGIIHFERRQLLADLRNGRPDVILVDSYLQGKVPFDWLAWAKADPELDMELRRYREAEDVGRVRIFFDQSRPER